MKLTFSKSICITTVPRVGRASNCFYAMFSNRLLVMVTNTFCIFTSSYDAKEFSTFDAHHFNAVCRHHQMVLNLLMSHLGVNRV